MFNKYICLYIAVDKKAFKKHLQRNGIENKNEFSSIYQCSFQTHFKELSFLTFSLARWIQLYSVTFSYFSSNSEAKTKLQQQKSISEFSTSICNELYRCFLQQ